MSLEEQFSDACDQDEDCSYALFETYRNAIRSVSEWQNPSSPSLRRNPEAYFTDHGKAHLERVEQRADSLVRIAELDLNCCELFLLLLSVWTHDIAMLIHSDPDESDQNLRQSHHTRVIEIVARIQQARSLGDLPRVLKPLLGEITAAHSRGTEITSLTSRAVAGAHTIRVRLLGAILRIADACDLDYRRAPKAIFELYAQDIPAASVPHWQKHSMVTGLDFDQLSATIYVHFLPPGNELLETVTRIELLHWVLEELSSELDSVGTVFRENQVPLSRVRLKDNNSGELLDPMRIPLHDSRFVIRIRESATNLEQFPRLQGVLETHSGTHSVVIELIRASGTRVYIDAKWLKVDPGEPTVTASKEILGDAWVGHEVNTRPKTELARP